MAAQDEPEGADRPDVDDKLTPDEDAILRRLHWFESNGVELSPERRALLTSIRARDKRTLIREPPDVVVEEPVAKEEGDDSLV